MSYFRSNTQSDLVKVIENTQNSLYLSMPSLHQEVAQALNNLKSNNPKAVITLLLDYNPQTFRSGYGDIEAVNGLIEDGFMVKSLPDNRVSFIISDAVGYYLFTESRTLIPGNTQTINSVQIDSISIVRLKHFFFPSEAKENIEDELTNAIIEETKNLDKANEILHISPAKVEQISEDKIKLVQKNLDLNPPLHPDFKRTVEYYSNKFQYAELHFDGQNFQHFSIRIPSNLLPYKNKELRNKLITKLKLFENITQSEDFKSFNKLIDKKKAIAAKYLTSLTCRKNRSVLKIENKNSFNAEVSGLRKELDETKGHLYKTMVEEIKDAKSGLQQTLVDFFLENPTDAMTKMGVGNYPLMAENLSENLLNKLAIPDPSQWIQNFRITISFSDITYEDLRDQELLKELRKKGLIEDEDVNRLADFGKGIKLVDS